MLYYICAKVSVVQSVLKQFIQNTRIKNFVIYGVGQGINIISPLLVVPYLVSICGKDGYGRIGLGFSFALILNVLIDYGSYINGTREISIRRGDREAVSRVISSIYLLKLCLLLGFGIIAFLLVWAIPFFRENSEVYFLSYLYVVGQAISPIWIFQGLEEYKWISFLNIFSKVVYVVFVFCFISIKSDYVFVNAYLGIGLIISSLTGFLSIVRRFQLVFDLTVIKGALMLFKNEASLTFSQLLLSFYQYLPIMIISAVGGNTLAGQYRIIDQVIMQFRTYLQMFFNFAYADICLQLHLDKAKGIKNWMKYNGLNYLMVLGIAATVFIFSHPILAFFNIPAQEIPTLAVSLQIGLLIPVTMGISFALKQLLFALNKNREYIYATIFTTILSLATLYYFLRISGLKGAFLSTIVIESLVIALYGLILRRTFRSIIRR